MKEPNERRIFLKSLFSLSAFFAGSSLSFNRNRGFKNKKIMTTEALGMGTTGKRVKKIALEEHSFGKNIEEQLRDIDEAGIDMQVIAYLVGGPGATNEDFITSCKKANEEVSKIVEKYPERFAGYSMLPMQDPDAAARELERAVKELGLKGPFIYAGDDGSYLDEKKYWGIYELLEKLDLPIYIHPPGLVPDMREMYNTPYPILNGSMWGWASGTALQAMRLIVSGVFDKYPNLKVILGHLGEGIPYFLWRIDNRWSREDKGNIDLKKKPSQYFKENFYVTTSGMFWNPVLDFVISTVGEDRILFATDYPAESAIEAVQFIDSMPMSADCREKICHLNAEKLLKI